MIKKGEWALILFNALYIFAFIGYYALIAVNYEFLVYVGVIVLLFFFVCFLQRRVHFDYLILWMLSLWGLLHMMGGGLRLANGNVLYKWIVLPIFNGGGEFVILKFDQVLHFYIYFVMSFVLAHLLLHLVKKEFKPLAFYTFVVLASMGMSVINELVEFGIVLVLPSSGVGGYYNTLLDLSFNTAGALLGALAHRLRRTIL